LTQLSASPADLLPQSDLPQSCLSQSCLPENCLPELGVAPCDLPPTAPGAGPETCSLDTIQQTMERLPGGCRRLAVQLRTALDPQWLWAVLTDYDELSRFIPNLQTSRLLWRRANVVGLEQEGAQTFMGLRFKARVQLELTEHSHDHRLSFVMSKGDFRRFEGTWAVGHDGVGTTLFYELTVQGCVGMPIGLIEQRLREDLAANLRAVQQEAQRRAALA
jgi:ribosome-associated toxin RatA of RatAB toxin-antitoxin module